jgi:hypothetical protein
MAATTYRYRSTQPVVSTGVLQREVDPTLSVVRMSPQTFVDITVDDSRLPDLDDAMLLHGFTRIGAGGPLLEPGACVTKFQKTLVDATGAAVVPELPILENRNGLDITVLSVRIVPNAALIAHAANFATWTVRRRDATGALIGTVASAVTSSVGLSAFVARDFGAITFQPLVSGDQLTFEQAKSGLGVVVPAGCVEIAYRVGP